MQSTLYINKLSSFLFISPCVTYQLPPATPPNVAQLTISTAPSSKPAAPDKKKLTGGQAKPLARVRAWQLPGDPVDQRPPNMPPLMPTKSNDGKDRRELWWQSPEATCRSCRRKEATH